MTPSDKIKAYLDKWKAVDEAATPGPWWHEVHGTDKRGTGVLWQKDAEFPTGFGSNLKTVSRCDYGTTGWNAKTDEEFHGNAEFIAFSRTASPIHRAVIEKCVEALKKYMHHIPVHRVISPESAAYEQEFGIGRLARETLAEIATMLEGDKK